MVGFLDNDSLFTTVVTPESLFDKNKRPIIIGKHTPYKKYAPPRDVGNSFRVRGHTRRPLKKKRGKHSHRT